MRREKLGEEFTDLRKKGACLLKTIVDGCGHLGG